MLDEMEHLIAREYSGRLQLQMAEYKALQAQINPHFLYNTLDTMSSIAQIQKCGVVSNLSESLSTMFRYSLDMDSPMSTVWKEILHLKNYIRVMDVRMNADVHYEFDIDERMRNALIPRLTLQPIVENALKYAFVGDGKDKTIRLTAGLKDGEGVIEVTDNGIGMNPDKLNAELKSNDLTYAYKGDSIGLHNINMRIKLLFGNEYGVRIESDPGDGAKVIARFPIRYEEADSEEETGETQE
jgi:sensor histidine kinase YesM